MSDDEIARINMESIQKRQRDIERRRCDEPADELATLRARLAEVEAERSRWREAAQAATPGGSEFCDPRSVREFIAEQRRELVQAKMEIVRLERAALAQPKEPEHD